MEIFVVILIMSTVTAVSFVDLVKEEWNAFKLKHNKSYENDVEDRFRMKIYAENKHRIAKHNQRYKQGLVSYSLSENKYGDLLQHEFVRIMNGFNRTRKVKKGLYKPKFRDNRGATFIPPAHLTYPDHVDWRDLGAVTEVKDQGKCGSCWAFSSTGALEGQHFRKAGVLVSLSEQNLIDCSAAYGNDGCRGGLMDHAFQYIKDNGGIDTEASYPYEGVEDKCRYDAKNSGADDVGFVHVTQGDEQRLLQAVAAVGPISVAIDASHDSFRFYSDGVYYDEECSNETYDHAMLVVGYGTDENGGDYWLVKNSWGDSWGQGGYIKIARNRNNTCGIASTAFYPLV